MLHFFPCSVLYGYTQTSKFYLNEVGTKINLYTWLMGIFGNLNFQAFSGLLIVPQIKYGFGPDLGLYFRNRA